jgi:drug/metabolite transporter (DMT)-like permease
MGIILALLAAVCWGTADFLASYATRLIGTYRTLFFMQFFGLIGLGVYLVASGELTRLLHSVGGHVWGWALLVALLNVVSSLALYRSFEVGTLAIVSPIAASSSALTVILSFLSGESLSLTQDIGILAVLLGVILAAMHLRQLKSKAITGQTARASGSFQITRGVSWAIAASIGYGLLFWLLGFFVTPTLGGVMPVWIVRVVTLCTLALCALPARQSLRLPIGNIWWLIAGFGILDTAAYVLASFALRTGQIAIVSVLASLFSAVTVILAWIFLREKLQWHQWLAICIILVGIVLVNV